MVTLIDLATAVIILLLAFAILLAVFWLKEKRARRALVRAKEDLEKRLQERSDQLSNASLSLQNEVNERRRTVEDLDKRDAVYTAIGQSAARLLASPDWESAIQPAMEQLGQALEVSRVSLVEAVTQASQPARFVRRFGWSAPETPAAENDLEGFYASFTDRLDQGQVCSGLAKDYSDEEGSFLKDRAVLSFLEIPIFISEHWWGLLGFEDCQRERPWSAAEIEMLSTLAKILGALLLRAQAQQALDASEERYRFLADQAADLITLHDRQGVCLYASPASLRLLGYEPQELVGRHFQELIHPDDLAKVLEEFQMTAGAQPAPPGERLRFPGLPAAA